MADENKYLELVNLLKTSASFKILQTEERDQVIEEFKSANEAELDAALEAVKKSDEVVSKMNENETAFFTEIDQELLAVERVELREDIEAKEKGAENEAEALLKEL